MGSASGESDIHFGTDMVKWGAEGVGQFFLACRRGIFFSYPMCPYSKCSDFCGEFKYG